jgi:hypothetical protein
MPKAAIGDPVSWQEPLSDPPGAGEDALFHFPLTRSATVEEEEEENEEVLETAFDQIFDVVTYESGLLQEIKIAEVRIGRTLE